MPTAPAGSAWHSPGRARTGVRSLSRASVRRWSSIEGDPDRPIITGKVYNAEQMPPYELPAGKVVSGLKSNSTKGGGGYNEMSMDDTKGTERITVHAQYDMGTTVEHDDTQTVHNNRTIQVDGTHTETIVKDTTIQITKGKLNHQVQTGTANYYVKDDIVETYDATQLTVAKQSIDIASSDSYIHVYADNNEIMLRSGLSSMVTCRLPRW